MSAPVYATSLMTLIALGAAEDGARLTQGQCAALRTDLLRLKLFDAKDALRIAEISGEGFPPFVPGEEAGP